MNSPTTCRTCGGNLTIRQTQKKPAQLQKAYYYTAYYYCSNCQKIYHDDKFKIENPQNTLFTENPPLPAIKNLQDIEVEIWTDGACTFNGQHNARAAWAFVSGTTEKSGLVPGDKQTNNVAEGLAIYHAIDWAHKNNFKKIKIYTDSQISLHNLKKPAHVIKQNREIFQNIENLIKNNQLHVHYEKVLGHSGDPNNTRADNLANQLASGL